MAAFEDLYERVRAFYEDYASPARGQGEVRLLPTISAWQAASWVPSAAVAFTDDVLELIAPVGSETRPLFKRQLRPTYVAAFLYGDTVIELDPLTLPRHPDPQEIGDMRQLAWSLVQLELLRPLIEARLLPLAPHSVTVPRQSPLAQHDAAVFGEWLRENPTMNHRFDGFDMTTAARALRVAEALDASAVPAFDWEWSYMAFRANRAVGQESVRVAASLVHADLPLFAGIAPKTLVQIHAEEETFVEWRRALRTATRLIRASCSADRFEREAREVYEDVLLPRITAVERTVSRTAALRQAAAAEPLRAAFGAAFSSTAAALAGLPLTGVLASTLAATASNIAYEVLRPVPPSGADAVLSLMVRDR